MLFRSQPSLNPDYWVQVGIPKFLMRYIQIAGVTEWKQNDSGKMQSQAPVEEEMLRLRMRHLVSQGVDGRAVWMPSANPSHTTPKQMFRPT